MHWRLRNTFRRALKVVDYCNIDIAIDATPEYFSRENKYFITVISFLVDDPRFELA